MQKKIAIDHQMPRSVINIILRAMFYLPLLQCIFGYVFLSNLFWKLFLFSVTIFSKKGSHLILV